jgi:site-specific recombinase XerD
LTTTSSATAVVPFDSIFTDPRRLAVAGFLASYRGLTRDAYELDLRQFVAWCKDHSLDLFDVRRFDIECFARDLEARGRARATVAHRLCTVAGITKPVGPGALRHAFITAALDAGVPLQDVQETASHADPRTTM